MKKHEPSDLLVGIGAKIRAAREERKWSQAELGRRVGRGRSLISFWEQGQADFSLDDLAELAEIFGPCSAFAPIIKGLECVKKYAVCVQKYAPDSLENSAPPDLPA